MLFSLRPELPILGIIGEQNRKSFCACATSNELLDAAEILYAIVQSLVRCTLLLEFKPFFSVLELQCRGLVLQFEKRLRPGEAYDHVDVDSSTIERNWHFQSN
jgi:hypothetical protein